jgi:hypothetical protein
VGKQRRNSNVSERPTAFSAVAGKRSNQTHTKLKKRKEKAEKK